MRQSVSIFSQSMGRELPNLVRSTTYQPQYRYHSSPDSLPTVKRKDHKERVLQVDINSQGHEFEPKVYKA